MSPISNKDPLAPKWSTAGKSVTPPPPSVCKTRLGRLVGSFLKGEDIRLCSDLNRVMISDLNRRVDMTHAHFRGSNGLLGFSDVSI